MLSKKVISAVLVAGMLAATTSTPALADGPRGGGYHGNDGAGIFAGVLGALVIGSLIANASSPAPTTTYYVPQTTYYPPQPSYSQSSYSQSSSGPVEGRDFIYSTPSDSSQTQGDSAATTTTVYTAPQTVVYTTPAPVYYSPAPVYYSPSPYYYDPFFWPTVDLFIGGAYWFGGHGGGHGGWHGGGRGGFRGGH
jgi:hypothetical protein